MRRLIAAVLVLMLACAAWAGAETAEFPTGETIFNPDYMVEQYNASIVPFFQMLDASALPSGNQKSAMSLHYVGEADGMRFYTNDDDTVRAIFSAYEESLGGPTAMLWTSLEDKSVFKNIPTWVFAYACSNVLGDSHQFTLWAIDPDRGDEDIFSGSGIMAIYGGEAKKDCWLMCVKAK